LLDTNGPVTIGSDTRKPTAYDVFGATAVYTLVTGNTTTVASNHLSPVSVSATDTTAADLLAFQAAGGGIFDVLFTTLTGTLLSNTGGNTSAGQVTTATSTVSISYTYDTIPIPEPASIALLGAGLLSVGAIRRKRRSQRLISGRPLEPCARGRPSCRKLYRVGTSASFVPFP